MLEFAVVVDNHPHSERSKAPRIHVLPKTHIMFGDLVIIYGDRNKSRARDRYLVVSIDSVWCSISRFVGSQLRNMSYRV